MFVIEREISKQELEPLYHHVHHAHAIVILEEARLSYLKQIGFPNQKLIEQGLFLVLTRISVRYLRELLAGVVEVTCENPIVKSRLMRVDQRILLSSGEPAIEAQVDFMCLQRDKGHAVVPPRAFKEAFLG